MVQITKEQILTAGDGKQYKITVTCDADAGIPADAELRVSELTEGSEYDKYVKKAAKKLGTKEKNLAFARAFDIALVNPESGEHYQPAKPLKVSVELLDENVNKDSDIDVVHFGDETEVMKSRVNGKAVEFETDGFSVYVVTANNPPLLTFKFHVYSSANNAWTQYGLDARIKAGEKPTVPQPPSDGTLEFAGWYRCTDTPADPTNLQNWNDTNGNWTVDVGELTDASYDFDNIPGFTSSGVVNLYARYERFANVIFHDQYDSEAEEWPVAFSRRVALRKKLDSSNAPVLDGEGNPVYEGTVRIDDLRTTYSGSERLACYGWSYTPVKTPGVYKNPSTGALYTISANSISVTGQTELYPIYRTFHRLTFYAAQSRQDASYVPTQTKFEDEGFGQNEKLPTTSRPGYEFQGWYTGRLVTSTENGKTVETVQYGSQVTDETGSLLRKTTNIPYLFSPVMGMRYYEGMLFLSADATLYAKWKESVPEPTYQLIFWKQSQPSSDSYIYHTTSTLPVAGTSVSFDSSEPLPAGVDLTGYVYDHDDGPKSVSSSGTTVLNVYYKLNDGFTPNTNYTLTFADSMDGAAMTSPGAVNIEPNTLVKDALGTTNTTPEDKKSDRGYVTYKFGGWYMDRDCTIPANLDTMTMPACDVTIYARWEPEWFIVNIDPNYGALYTQKSDGSLEGTGSTWFWQTCESELIGEYTHVTRDYVQSSGGNYYYVNRNRAFYGYSGNEWDNNEEHCETFYTSNSAENGASDTTYEYAPGSYSYMGWYEVYPDGSEATEPYDFNHHTDHDLTLRLRWKRSGQFYLAFDAGTEGYLDADKTTWKNVVSELTVGYADHAEIELSQQVFLPDTSEKVFIGWRRQGDTSGVVYPIGGVFTLHAEDAKRDGGKDVIWLEAVYADAGSNQVTIVYDANGGTISETFNSGAIPNGVGNDSTPANGVRDTENQTVAVPRLNNNSRYILSNGTGFSWVPANVNGGIQITPAGWSNTRVYNPDDSASEFYSLNTEYGVDLNGGNTTTLYAAWPVTVTYRLNNTNGSWNSANWNSEVYRTDSDGNYQQTRYIGWENGAVAGSPVPEPADIPTSTDRNMFFYWTKNASVPNPEPYDFSTPVTEDLTLYAVWGDLVSVPVHAVDASGVDLSNKTSEWVTTPNIQVGAEDVTLNETTAASYVTVPSDYKFAFAAALNRNESLDRENISEADAIQAVYYNQAKKHLYVKYKDLTRADAILNEDTDIYFFYYEKKSLSISYKAVNSSGVLSEVTVDSAAPKQTLDENSQQLKLGEYDVASHLTQPMTWVTGYQHYSYAIGERNAENAAGLRAITQTGASDDDRPKLQVRNSWQGFLYSTDDGRNWESCGYDPALYVVYFEQKPTVIMIHEETFGSEAVLDTPFTYHILVTQLVNGSEDTEYPVYDSDHVRDPVSGTETQHSYSLTSGKSQSAVLFYNNDGSGTEITQKITVTQAENQDFTTTVDEAQTREWTCTSTAGGGTVHVTFTNKHKALTVPSSKVHAALFSTDGVTIQDSLWTGERSFQVKLGEEKTLETLPPQTVTSGGVTYALGAIGYGTDTSGTVTLQKLGLNTIAYGQVSGNHYELLLNGKKSSELGAYSIYCLYYPAASISYLKATDNSSLENVRGANSQITYDGDALTMNGKAVVQDQTVPIPVNGVLAIRQSGNGSFRMPPYLDDGGYLRYLAYTRLGLGQKGQTDVNTITPVTPNDAKTLYLRVGMNGLQYSNDRKEWNDCTITSPTVYAIYEERGYDLMITKTVPAQKSELSSLFMGATFHVSIQSNSITETSYKVEGYERDTIAATPANGATPGRIDLDVSDGTSVRILSLGQGTYTVTESQNENYELTANKGSIVGNKMSSVAVNNNAILFSLDSETKLALTNTPNRLCRIVDDGIEHIFFTFADAVKYVEDNVSDKTATIEMLSNYTVPVEDILNIPYGFTITLDSAASLYKYGDAGSERFFDSIAEAINYVEQSGDLADNKTVKIYYLSQDLDPTKLKDAIPTRYKAKIQLEYDTPVSATPKTLTRTNNLSNKSIIKSEGRLTIQALTLDGASVQATEPLIHSSGDLTVGKDAIIKNAINSASGSAVEVTEGSITVSGTFRNNQTSSNGGAIYYSGDQTILIDESASFENNQATGNGGAIYAVSGTITVSGNASFENNQATGNGGAIYGMSTVVSVTGAVKVSNNQAANGGAVYIATGAFTASDYVDPESKTRESPTIQNNHANGTDDNTGNGGAIYVGSGTVTVNGGTLGGSTANDGNTARKGGVIYAASANVTLEAKKVYTSTNPGESDITSVVTIQNNQASHGGAIYAQSGTVTAAGVSITQNKATDGNGGAIYADSGNLTLSGGVSVTKNTATNGNGGAVYADVGTVTITDCTLGGDSKANSAQNGGAVYAKNGLVSVSNSYATHNTASENGGAIYAQNGNVTMTMTSVQSLANNSARNGGAIYAGKGAVSVSGGSVADNTAISGNGGAICTNSGNTTLSDNSVTGNRSTGGHGGAVYSDTGSANLTNCTTVTGNTAASGNGGVICTDKGSVTVSTCTVDGTGDGNANAAQNGGVVYTTSGAINVSDSTIKGNQAIYTTSGATATEPETTGRGGALCTVSGNVTVSASILGGIDANDANDGNTARNGGAVFSQSGNITVSGLSYMKYNTATVYGGAIYEGSGTVNINGTVNKDAEINIRCNTAQNGAAIFVETGSGVLSGSSKSVTNIQENIASTDSGGAVGVGSANARLFFSGNVKVKKNTKLKSSDDTNVQGNGPVEANVYLDWDTDTVINGSGLGSNSEIKIYVPGPFSDDLFKNRGAASALFGSYSSESSLVKFINDRNTGLTAQKADNNKIQWVKKLTVDVRYLASIPDANNFPPQNNGTLLFTLDKDYVMPTSTNGASQIAEDLYANHETDKLKTPYPQAGFACVFKDGESSFDNYLTAVNWDGATGQWKFIRRDGTELTNISKLIVYFADTSYLSIVNNTNEHLTLNISSLSVLGRDAANNGHYGYVTAKNGMTPDTMEPIAASDLSLAPGQSRKFLFPGAMGKDITLSGTFSKTGGTVPNSIQYIVDGDVEHRKTLSLTAQPFTLMNGTQPYTLPDAGKTREFIFGEKALEICLVRAEGQENTPDADLPKFPSFTSAIEYIEEAEAADPTPNKKYSIEMLVDYLLPSSDKCELPGGYDITLTTANSYAGDGDERRAIISRDAGNMSDAIVKFINNKATFVNNAITGALTIENLIFDGRSLAGSGDGGAVTTMNACVMIDNCLFKGVEAINGGAIFVDFTASNDKNTPYQNQNENVKQATLTITNTEFLNCRSSSNEDKTGGGAIWTTARELTLDFCVFNGSSCYKDKPSNATDKGTAQAGAVFHNINDNPNDKGRIDVFGEKKPKSFSDNTKTHISNCTFTDCYTIQASAGAVESDALNVLVENCTFNTCYVKRGKNGGGLNIYANNEENPNKESFTTVKGCTFINCSSPNNGGAFRTTSTKVKVENTTFTKCSGKNGGGFAAMGNNALSLTLNGVTVDSCTALSGGYAGGIYTTAATVTIEDTDDGKHTEVKNCTGPGQGGGIYHNRSGNNTSFTMTNAIITGNSTTGSTGGGIHTKAKTVTITGSSISNNTAKNQGGGLYANPQNNDAVLTINGTAMSGNTSSSSDGGGVWYDGKDETVRSSMTLYLYGCKIDGNAANIGGGVYTLAKTMIVGDDNSENASISNNTARSGNGGGIWHSRDVEGSTLTVTNAAIKGNETKTDNGGGVWTNVRTLTLTGADVSGNTAKNYGGGVYYDASEASRPLMALTVSGCTLDGNTATNYYGGGIYTLVRTVTIGKNGETGTTVSGCTAKTGGGVYHSFPADANNTDPNQDSSLTIIGSTISGCRATTANGGGVYTNVRTLSVTGSTVSSNTSSANGGGVWYDSTSQDPSTAASQRAVMALTLTDSTVTANTASSSGGGIYTGVDSVTIQKDAGTMTISNNTALNGSGGGIHQQSSATNSALTVTGAAIKGNNTYGPNKLGKGGGIYTKARTVTIQTSSELSGNTASRNGGGICHDSAPMNRDLILDSSVVMANLAGEKGGGVYFAESDKIDLDGDGTPEHQPRACFTMRHNAQVINNRLTGNAENAAGVYLPDFASLRVGYVPKDGEQNTTFDTVVINSNQTAAGQPSNLRLWSNDDDQNNENSVYVYCGLTTKDENDPSKPYSEVRVVNANRAGTRFGVSHINNPRGFVQGFSADKAVFKADDDSLFGVIDRAETKKIYIIWGGPAICKITDPVGTLLYLNLDNSGMGADPAVFDQLDTGDVNDTSINSAFSLLRAANPQLYYADGAPYDRTAYCVKMLDSFTTQNRIIIPAGKTITFTTAGRNDALYPFEYSKTYKSKNDIATVTRGKNVGNFPLVNTETDLTLLNLTLDGGSLLTGEDKPAANSNTSLLKVDSDTITVKLKGATLQNSETTGNGGGVYVNRGKLILGEDVQNGDAQIRNCKAVNGGGVYAAADASVEFRRGQVYGCAVNGDAHNGSGGGIYLANGGAGTFTMTGGTISHCNAQSSDSTGGAGGGIYVGDDRKVTMTGGKIQENTASNRGGGIAVDSDASRLYFAEAPIISHNTCSKSDAAGKICNVELDKDTNQVIQTKKPGLYNGASIGVYVPGEDDDPNGLYENHGEEKKPFGTYDPDGELTTFYSFINDRNGYKGGMMGANDYEKRIFWVKIFSLEVAIQDSEGVDRDEKFQFQVTLSGTSPVADQKDAKDIHGTYGQMTFYSSGIDTTALVDLQLETANDNWQDGVHCIGENLSQDLSYQVQPLLTDEQAKKYVLVPQNHTGKIGEFNEPGVTVDENERYISRAIFKVIPAVCKLTDSSDNLLYYYYEDEYRAPLNPNNDGCQTGVIHYIPAVYPSLESAATALKDAAENPSDVKKALYLDNNSTYTITQGVKIQMLTSYQQKDSVSLPTGVPVILTTADKKISSYPYHDTGSIATIYRGYTGDPLLTVNPNSTVDPDSKLTLKNITLNGEKGGETYYASQDGGFVKVNNSGTLIIEANTTLQKSHSQANGGAVYVSDGGVIEMNAGTIRQNVIEPNFNGAGIYLESGATMNLSGNPYFGGTDLKGGTDTDKNQILGSSGNFKEGDLKDDDNKWLQNGGVDYKKARQDIYIAENNANHPASLVITDDLTGEPGSIWVWAENENHHKQLMPFARLNLPTEKSFVANEKFTGTNPNELDAGHLEIFRNARDDVSTKNTTGNYLRGRLKDDNDANEAPGYVYWNGVKGSARVMLVKVGDNFEALSGVELSIYTDASMTKAAMGKVLNSSGTGEDMLLTNLTSGANGTSTPAGGAFFIGTLPYGTYYVQETSVGSNSNTGYSAPNDQHFEFTIGDGGVVKIEGSGTSETKTPVKIVTLTDDT